MNAYYLALDQGGHAGRAIAFDREGHRLAQATIDVPTQQPAPDRYEQDPQAVVDSLERAAILVVRKLKDQTCLGAGLATQRSSIACWDRETGQALSPVISWRDTRNASALAALDLDESRLHEITGLRSSAHYGASKLRWCLDNIPAVRRAYESDRLAWGPLASFLVFRLTREKTLATDPVNASRTLLWEPGCRRWSSELADLFGVPLTPLPPGMPEDSHFGHLKVCTKIALLRCTGDQAAAIHSQGTPTGHDVIVNAGTGAFVLQPANWPNTSHGVLTSVVAGNESGLSFALEGTVNGAGSALKSEAGRLAIDKWQSVLETQDSDLSTIPAFLNGHSGLGSPWWIPDFESRHIGNGGPIERLIAVIESIVFMLQTNLEAFAGHASAPQRIIASGGVSKGDAFCRKLANLSGLPVIRHRISEATAQGLAWLLTGVESPWPPESPPERFEPESDGALWERYEHWKALMTQACGSYPV
jgi:glycerol kinase